MLTTERYVTRMSKRLLQGQELEESLASMFRGYRAREVHPVIIRAPKIMSFSGGSSKQNGLIESPASDSWH